MDDSRSGYHTLNSCPSPSCGYSDRLLAIFAWLLTLHPTGAGRTYAAYGGVYVATAIAWIWLVEGQRPDAWDLIGAGVSVIGMAIIFFTPRA